MPTQSEDQRPVTFINVFEIPHEEVAAFIATWEHRSRLIAGAEGFISAELHEATELATDFRLINVSTWRSRDDFDAATGDPVYQSELAAYASDEKSTWVPHRGFYRTAAKVENGRVFRGE